MLFNTPMTHSSELFQDRSECMPNLQRPVQIDGKLSNINCSTLAVHMQTTPVQATSACGRSRHMPMGWDGNAVRHFRYNNVQLRQSAMTTLYMPPGIPSPSLPCCYIVSAAVLRTTSVISRRRERHLQRRVIHARL